MTQRGPDEQHSGRSIHISPYSVSTDYEFSASAISLNENSQNHQTIPRTHPISTHGQQHVHSHYSGLSMSENDVSTESTRQRLSYANSWHEASLGFGRNMDPPRLARRAASSQNISRGQNIVTYPGRSSRQTSVSHSPGIISPPVSQHLGPQTQTRHQDEYIPLQSLSAYSLPHNHNTEDAILPYNRPSIETVGTLRRSFRSQHGPVQSMESLYGTAQNPNDGETPQLQAQLSRNTSARTHERYSGHTSDNPKVESPDERSIATSADGSEVINRQDLRRRLHERHVGMIALTGAIGIGLFLTSGRVLKIAGPGGAVLAYFLMGTVANAVMACLGEMTALISIPGPMSEFASRFVDDSLGFAVGWMFWFTHAIGLASETTAAAILMTFVYKNTGVTTIPTPEFDWPKQVFASNAVWIAIFLILVLLVNLLPVRIYGELEYAFAWFKLVCIIGLIFLMLVLNLRNEDRYGRVKAIGFRYWSRCSNVSTQQYSSNCTRHPEWGFFSQAFDSGKQKIWANESDPIRLQYLEQGGHLGRLKSVWTALTLAFYAYLGMEIISVTAAESRAPAQTIKTSTRKMFWRLATIYCFAMFVGSLNVPYTHPNLLSLRPDNSDIQGKVSPFIIAVVEAGIVGLPSFLNALFLFAAWSAGVSALFVSSRTMHAMALAGHFPWPKMKEVNKYGVPFNAMLLSWSVGFLAFLQSGDNAQEILGYLVKLGTISCLIVYACISVSYIRFFEGRDPRYPYRSRFQPARAWYGLIGSSMVILFNGWEFCTTTFVDMNGARAKGFVFSYLALLGFITLYVLRKLWTKSEIVPIASMDFAGAQFKQEANVIGKHWLMRCWDWLK